MEPLTLLTWVGAIALCIVMTAIAVQVVWYSIQTMRGKIATKQKPSTTVIQNGRN